MHTTFMFSNLIKSTFAMSILLSQLTYLHYLLDYSTHMNMHKLLSSQHDFLFMSYHVTTSSKLLTRSQPSFVISIMTHVRVDDRSFGGFDRNF